ncbi:hypothetical protein SAMN05444921_11427 [Streptomyces wuyuanensis]|uniref:Uncharacterized protein n=1 Tax=Streptomyces wuyuanensis TaxID=1196353 RepID=A0A1G9WJ70_9ACTN|nr:hypothetical protein SAMN05444921_11427 [Streptomyces wuyuanensis]
MGITMQSSVCFVNAREIPWPPVLPLHTLTSMPTRGNAAVERLMQGTGLHEALGATEPEVWL